MLAKQSAFWELEPQAGNVEAFKFWKIIDNFNELWADSYARYGGAPHDDCPVISTQRSLTEGVWERNTIVLGYPLLQYDDLRLHVTRNIGHSIRLRLVKANGGKQLQVVTVDYGWKGDILKLVCKPGTRWATQYESSLGMLNVYWQQAPDCTVEGDSDLQSMFREYFTAHKNCDLLRLPTPIAAGLKKVIVQYEPSEAGAIWVHCISLSTQAAAKNRVPSNDMETNACSVSNGLGVFFYPEVFPNIALGIRPLDADWVVRLALPGGRFHYAGGNFDRERGHYHVPYNYLPADQARVRNEDECLVVPMAQIIGNDRRRVPLAVSPDTPVEWNCEGDAKGILEKENGQHYYKPPGPSLSAAVFNTNSDTLIPVAYRYSVAQPAQTDLVTATSQAGGVTAPMTVCVVPPTHFIKAEKQAERLVLSLHWLNLNHEEREVPPSSVEWTTLAGNGDVLPGGIFTPGASGSKVSVLMAVDTSHDDEWRWAVSIIPMPLLSADEVVAMLSE